MKFSYEIVKDMSVLSTDLQVKTVLKLKTFCKILMSFYTKLLHEAPCLL